MFRPYKFCYFDLSTLSTKDTSHFILINLFTYCCTLNQLYSYLLVPKEQIIGGDQVSVEVGNGVSSSTYADDRLLSS
jgi:hypothetical protein